VDHRETRVRIAFGDEETINELLGDNDVSMTSRWPAALLFTLFALAAPAAAQIDPRTALVERAAWAALEAGRAQAAADGFRDAIAADPKNARLHLGAGMAAALERRDADARDAFERALALDPKLDQARLLLGHVQHRSGDLQSAIRTYETLLDRSPDNPDAQATLERWRREVDLHDRMREAVGSHFSVSFEGPAEEALAAQALEALDRAFWRIGQLLGTYPTDPIPVVLYTTEQFRDITRSPSWAAGAYDGTIRVPMRGALDQPAELERVLSHEFTHAVVRSLAARGVPAWLNEGLAAALETGDLRWADALMTRAGTVPLRTLQSGFGRFTGDQAQLAYAASALAAQRLLDEAGGPAITNLLRDLGNGVDFDAAFLHRIQRSFADFQSALF
jgi:tetratricopeptide (TPR) repeat protein